MSKEKIEKCDDERESSSTLLLEKQKTKQTHSHTRVDDDGDGGARSPAFIIETNSLASKTHGGPISGNLSGRVPPKHSRPCRAPAREIHRAAEAPEVERHKDCFGISRCRCFFVSRPPPSDLFSLNNNKKTGTTPAPSTPCSSSTPRSSFRTSTRRRSER